MTNVDKMALVELLEQSVVTTDKKLTVCNELETSYNETLSKGSSNLSNMVTPEQVEKFLTERGYVQDYVESNGWQNDFEISYRPSEHDGHNEHKIEHCGCWYYGDQKLQLIKGV